MFAITNLWKTSCFKNVKTFMKYNYAREMASFIYNSQFNFFIIWNYIFFLYISIQRKQYPYSFQKRLTNIYFASMRKIRFLPYPCTNCQTVLNRQKYFYRNMPFLENYNSLFVESRKYYEDISKVCNIWLFNLFFL